MPLATATVRAAIRERRTVCESTAGELAQLLE
jgi:hypothetical protein